MVLVVALNQGMLAASIHELQSELKHRLMTVLAMFSKDGKAERFNISNLIGVDM